MKSILKVVGIAVVVLVIAVIFGVSYFSYALPDIDVKEDISVEANPERLERGEYLANHVSVCMDCHATRDWSLYAAPPVEGTLGQGGEVFDQTMNFPGRFLAPNITPYGVGDWSDAELYRAITSGVSKDGRALFSIMPYPHFGKMSKEDIYSIIAYIKSLEAIENDVDVSEADFPMSIIINTIPSEPEHQEIPSPSDPLAYGEYMVNAAGCYDCHTKMEKGEFIGEDFAGGFAFNFPNGDVLISPNITPSKSGIGGWTKSQFISKFKAYSDSSYTHSKVGPGEMQTVMPWTMYGGMTEQDLGAIYEYLRTVSPVENEIVKFMPANLAAREE